MCSPSFRTSVGTRITEPAMHRLAGNRDGRTSRPDERFITSRQRSPPTATPARPHVTSIAAPPVAERIASTRSNGQIT